MKEKNNCARRQWRNVYRVLNEKHHKARILSSAKLNAWRTEWHGNHARAPKHKPHILADKSQKVPP